MNNWQTGFTTPLPTEDATGGPPVHRVHAADMAGFWHDKTAPAITGENPLIYEVYAQNAPKTEGDLSFGLTLLRAGKIGGEYYMTKGHYHTLRATAEVYYCTAGTGGLLVENEEGDCRFLPCAPGQAVYVPAGYAHRMVNTGSQVLACLYAFRADAGHDYDSIAQKGFGLVVVEEDGRPALKKNSKTAPGEETDEQQNHY